MTASFKLDPAADALYITLRDGQVARTHDFDARTNVDLDADGAVLGIEVLSPGQPWPLHWILRWYDEAISDEDAMLLMAMYPSPVMETA